MTGPDIDVGQCITAQRERVSFAGLASIAAVVGVRARRGGGGSCRGPWRGRADVVEVSVGCLARLDCGGASPAVLLILALAVPATNETRDPNPNQTHDHNGNDCKNDDAHVAAHLFVVTSGER